MKTRRIISTVMAVLFVLSTLTFGSVTVSAADAAVYVDQTSGSDGAAGTEAAPMQTVNAAISKLPAEGGTIYLLSDYEIPAAQASITALETGLITIEGVGDKKKFSTPAGYGANIYINSPIKFVNVNVTKYDGTYPHYDTRGNAISFGYNASADAIFHAGNDGLGTASENVTVDVGEGNSVGLSGYSISGGYATNPTFGVNGNVNVNVISGTYPSVKLSQDGWNDSQGRTTIYGNVNLKVGAKGEIGAVSNGGVRAAVLKGYFNVIVEEGGKMCDIDLSDNDLYAHKEIYRVNVTADRGTIEFGANAGEFKVVAQPGYVADVTFPDGSASAVTDGSVFTTQAGVTTVKFVNGNATSDSANLMINPAAPGATEYPVDINLCENISIKVASVSPATEKVEYAATYTYAVELVPEEGYVFPMGFSFTINGSDDYKIHDYVATSKKISFTYKVAATARDDSRFMVTYDGRIGSAGETPMPAFYEAGTEIEIAANPFTRGGFSFGGFEADGVVYQPGEKYTVNADTAFVAKWVAMPQYTVSFYGNDSTGGYAPEAIAVYGDTYVTLPENTFTKYGYNFVGWALDGSEAHEVGEMILVTDKDQTYFAMWEKDIAAGSFIYLDNAEGDDNAAGTEAAPVRTLKAAFAKAGSANATIVVMGSVKLGGELPANAAQITISGYDENAVLNMSGKTSINGDLTIKDIKVNVEKGAYIVSNGNKVVLGPNLDNISDYRFDYIDGKVAGVAENLNTTLNSGVEIGTYYIGGSDSGKEDGVAGNADITINGADINTLDFYPKNADTNALFGGYILVQMNSGKVGELKASGSFAKLASSNTVAVVLFNNNTFPKFDSASFISTLKAGRSNVYVADIGVGGTTSFDIATSYNKINATADSGSVFKKGTKGYTALKTSAVTLTAGQVNYIRFGAVDTNAISADIAAPTGGAEAFSIKAVSSSTNNKVILSGWTPELLDGRFGYEIRYGVDVAIVNNDGFFFDDTKLPVVEINGVPAEVTYNTDGTLTAHYQFADMTDDAPSISVSFEAGSPNVSGSVPAVRLWKHLSTGNTMPSAMTLHYLGYRFKGWYSAYDGKTYPAGSAYSVTSEDDLVFTAKWEERGMYNVPTVMIMYDLTALSKETARNPKFASSDKPIEMASGVSVLENAINGTKTLKTETFDYEKAYVLASDGSSTQMQINDYVMNKAKADCQEYKFLTIVYYYKSEKGNAVGDHPYMTYGNAQLADGSTSSWFGKGVTSEDTVVANKWATVTYDMSDAIAASDIPEGAVLRQCHIWPIGQKTCAQLEGDVLYLKTMFLSKEAPTAR